MPKKCIQVYNKIINQNHVFQYFSKYFNAQIYIYRILTQKFNVYLIYGKYNYVGRVNCHLSVYQHFNGQYVHRWTVCTTFDIILNTVTTCHIKREINN